MRNNGRVSRNSSGGHKRENNDLLADQIGLAIMFDHTEKKLSSFENGRGEIEYMIRDGQLQKSKFIKRTRLRDSGDNQFFGMSRGGMHTYKMLIESKLKMSDVLDYASINVTFEINTDGEFVDGDIIIITEEHYTRL